MADADSLLLSDMNEIKYILKKSEKEVNKDLEERAKEAEENDAIYRRPNSLDFQKLVYEKFQENYTKKDEEKLERTIWNYFQMRDHAIENVLDTISGIVKTDAKNKNETVKLKRFLKVLMKDKQTNGSYIFKKSEIENWLDDFIQYGRNNSALNKNQIRFLTAKSTRDRAISNIESMLEFPPSQAYIPTNKFLTEPEALDLLKHNPAILPEGEEYFDYERMLAVSNIIEFEYLRDKKGALIYSVTGRGKNSVPDALKWGLYLIGLRPFPHYDGTGITIISPTARMNDWDRIIGEKLGKVDECEPRYTNKENKIPTRKERLEGKKRAIQKQYELIENPHKLLNAPRKEDKEAIQSEIIYGDWVDVSMPQRGVKMEMQIKDKAGNHVYQTYASLSHFSKDYNQRRTEKMWQDAADINKQILLYKITKELIIPIFKKVSPMNIFNIDWTPKASPKITLDLSQYK